MDIDGKTEALRIGGGISLVTIWGVTLNEWVAILTIFYMGIQIILLSPKVYKMVAGGIKKLIQ